MGVEVIDGKLKTDGYVIDIWKPCDYIELFCIPNNHPLSGRDVKVVEITDETGHKINLDCEANDLEKKLIKMGGVTTWRFQADEFDDEVTNETKSEVTEANEEQVWKTYLRQHRFEQYIDRMEAEDALEPVVWPELTFEDLRKMDFSIG